MKRNTLIGTIGLALVGLWLVLGLLQTGTAVAAPAAHNPDQTETAVSQPDAVEQAVRWLIDTHQNEDGGTTSFSTGADQAPSDVGGTLDALLAISSGGYNAALPAPGQENSPVDYLRQNAEATAAYAAADGSTAGKLVLALVAAEQNPRDFAGNDFVLTLTEHLSPTGQLGVNTAFNQSLAILGLSAANEPVPELAVSWLLDQQAAEGDLDGSWDDGFGTMGNADATAMAIMALVAADVPVDDPALVRAADFLARTQLPSGGWEYGSGFGESVNSTALVLQALSALRQDFYSPDGPYAQDGVSPLMALLRAQSETGAFQADFGDGPFDDFFTTVQAIPALTGKPYPWPGYAAAAETAVACLATLQDPETGGWEQFATFGVNAAGTSRAVQAIAGVGDDPTGDAYAADGVTPLQALADLTPAFVAGSRGGGIGIVMEGVAAADGDVTDFSGLNLVVSMTQVLSPTGEYDHTNFGPFSHAQAIDGLLAAGMPEAIDETAVSWLLAAHTDGDFGGADSTGLALNVLAQLDQAPPQTITALRQTQLADGGWGFDGSNPNSSSEVMQGLVAAGENPFAPQWSRVMSGTLSNAADAVLAQQGDNGCWPNLFGPGDDPFATTDAILLLTQAAEAPMGLPETAAEAEATEAEEMAEETAEPEPTAEPTATPEPTAVPTETPTVEPTTPPEPTAEPATAVAADVTDEDAETAETEAEPAPDLEPGSSAAPITLVVVALVLVGAAAWYMRRRP